MKHDQLCSIEHNLADSLASGSCFAIGHYPIDLFAAAASGKDGVVELDFFLGRTVRGPASDPLKSVAARFAEALSAFCRRHGADVADFVALSAIFNGTALEVRMLLTVIDWKGRCSVTQYAGDPMKRLRVLDHIGRIRRAS